jgi:hypothetical protein
MFKEGLAIRGSGNIDVVVIRRIYRYGYTVHVWLKCRMSRANREV